MIGLFLDPHQFGPYPFLIFKTLYEFPTPFTGQQYRQGSRFFFLKDFLPKMFYDNLLYFKHIFHNYNLEHGPIAILTISGRLNFL